MRGRGRYCYIGREEQFQQDFAADRVIDGKGMLALPGFINAHTHSAMSIFAVMPMISL